MTTPLLTGAPVCEVQVVIQGDIGGRGISRWRFLPSLAGTAPSIADVNAAGAAVRAFYAAAAFLPTGVSAQVQAAVPFFDVGSALVQGSVSMTTVPNVVSGSLAGNYAAGMGARVNWKTATISGRRLIKGATFVIPMASAEYTSGGALSSTAQTALINAANAYIAAMNTAGTTPVVWHRPPKGTTAGGLVGPINAVAVPSTPAGLRSRRS
jgi:hypothetical protein